MPTIGLSQLNIQAPMVRLAEKFQANIVQLNFNGLNIFGAMENCSRHG